MTPTDDTGGTPTAGSRLLPRPTPESAEFWAACARHELLLPSCRGCGRSWFPPSRRCQHCWSDDTEWRPSAGRGQVHSFTVYHRAYAPELAAELPYVVAVVQLDEGPRLVGNVRGSDPGEVRVGARVEVAFEDLPDGLARHAFRLAPDPPGPRTSS